MTRMAESHRLQAATRRRSELRGKNVSQPAKPDQLLLLSRLIRRQRQRSHSVNNNRHPYLNQERQEASNLLPFLLITQTHPGHFIATWLKRLLPIASLHESHHFFFRKHARGLLGMLVDARDATLACFDATSLQPVDDI